MQGLIINNTDESYILSFDKKIFSDEMLSAYVKFIELEYLARKVDFNDDIMFVAENIKSNLWNSQKSRLSSE